MVIASRRLALPHFSIPRMVLVFWLLHLIISLSFAFYMQDHPELPEAPWFSSPDWAGTLAHWDINWEMRIADQAYGPDFSPQTSAKFPLAALSARLLHQIFGVSIQVGLFIVNKIGVLAGFWALWCLVARVADPLTADRAIGYIACTLFGTGFIYWMSYPDPLFLAWWALAFVALFDGQPYRAGLWAALAVWTRPQGALLMPVFALSLLVAAVRADGFKRAVFSRVFWQKLLSACLVPSLALIAWVVRVSDVTAIPFSPYLAQRDVRQTGLMMPWQRIYERVQLMLSQPETITLGRWLEAWQLLLLIFTLLVLFAVWWRGKLRWELLLFTVASVFLPLLTDIFAIGRFATITFLPLAFVYLIPQRFRWLDTVLWCVGIVLSLLVLLSLNITAYQVGYVP